MVRPKPTFENLNLDLDLIEWRQTAAGEEVLVAIVEALGRRWVLVRSPGLVSVFSEHEWECFLDGAKKGEFDDLGDRAG